MSDLTSKLIQHIVEITGTACSAVEAKHLLAASNNDVEAAITLFFEDKNSLERYRCTDDVSITDFDNVRAPIAPVREQLVGPGDDNFSPNTVEITKYYTTTERMSNRNSHRVKVCPLRDFAREGALMEKQLQQAASSFEKLDSALESVSSNQNRTSSISPTCSISKKDIFGTSFEPKRKRLEDLYRPPIDIAFAGTFQAARTKAEILKRWLLVNVQSDNFDSQLLNRDVWSDKTLRKLMMHYFLLWQLNVDSSEGRRFVAFYHCFKLPYVCIIDPRTGEELWNTSVPKHCTVIPELQKFLSKHKEFSSEKITLNSNTLTTDSICMDIKNYENSKNICNHKDRSTSTAPNYKKKSKILELPEEEQIAVAIRNSIRESEIHSNVTPKSFTTPSQHNIMSNNDENNKMSAGKVCINSTYMTQNNDNMVGNIKEQNMHYKAGVAYSEQLGSAKDELTMIKLRLLNADGTNEIIQLHWPSNTLVKVLHDYISQKHPLIAKRRYKLICAFPRKNLQPKFDSYSLKEIGLHPSANLHITLDD